MSVVVEVANTSGIEIDEAAATALARRVLAEEGIENGELGLAFVAADEIRKRWLESVRISVAAIQPANASAACPDGRPPRSGVPECVNAFVAITSRLVRTKATRVNFAGAFESRSSNRELRSATWPENTR